MENLQPFQDDDKADIENQRLHLVKEKESLEKEQEEFERKRRTLAEEQAKLEAEKLNMQREHAEQVLFTSIIFLSVFQCTYLVY